MSQLRVYWPDETLQASGDSFNAGHRGDHDLVVPFPARRSRPPRDTVADMIRRAQLLYENRICPHCRYAVVEPLELEDGRVDQSGQVVPGTATLVGFHCCGCDREWPAD